MNKLFRFGPSSVFRLAGWAGWGVEKNAAKKFEIVTFKSRAEESSPWMPSVFRLSVFLYVCERDCVCALFFA